MADLEHRIEALRAELEALYIKAKAGEACLGDVLRKSTELDELLLERSSYHNGINSTPSAKP